MNTHPVRAVPIEEAFADVHLTCLVCEVKYATRYQRTIVLQGTDSTGAADQGCQESAMETALQGRAVLRYKAWAWDWPWPSSASVPAKDTHCVHLICMHAFCVFGRERLAKAARTLLCRRAKCS